MDTVMDRETLDAFVDGALDPEAAARVVVHLADHPADQAYVDRLVEAGALLAQAYGAPMTEAVPERIRATIFPQPASSPAAARRSSRLRAYYLRPGRPALVATAAAALVLMGLAIGRMAWSPPGDIDLTVALETRTSGPVDTGEGPARLLLVGTFLASDGRPCREYEILDDAARSQTRGLACRSGSGVWTDEVVHVSRLAAPVDRSDGAFVPAEGGGTSAILDPTLDRLGAGMVLTPSEEDALIRRAWGP